MGDELNADWGAGSLVRTTVLAVARVTEFVYYDVANKLAQCAYAVDDDVFAVINDIFGDEAA